MELASFILFAICLIVQAYYTLFYFQPLSKYKTPEYQSDRELSVSIIVAARNEGKHLSNLLNSLIKQEHTNYEVIIVNDRSTDDSNKILDRYSSQYSMIRILEIKDLPNGWTGKKNAIYQGIKMAQNEIILLTDADCIPNSNLWINEMTKPFGPETEFVLGFSPYFKKAGLLNLFIQYETIWTAMQYLSMALRGLPYMGVGRNLAYRKSTFQKSEFSEIAHIVGGDDDLLVNRLANARNTNVAIKNAAHVDSIPKMSWRSYLKQKIRHLSTGKHYHKKDRTRLGIFALCNLFGWILLLYLLIAGFKAIWILTLFGFRSTLFYIIFTRIGRKLGVRIMPLTLPFLDLYYNFFYLVVGLRALTAKRIKWN